MKKKLKQIAAYLLSLDEETRIAVLGIMAGTSVSALSGCQGQLKPKPEDGDTPNGYWSCINGQWVWIPEI